MNRIGEKYKIQIQTVKITDGIYHIQSYEYRHKGMHTFNEPKTWTITNTIWQGEKHTAYEINGQIEISVADFDRICKERICK